MHKRFSSRNYIYAFSGWEYLAKKIIIFSLGKLVAVVNCFRQARDCISFYVSRLEKPEISAFLFCYTS